MLTLLLLMTSPLRAELPIEDDAWIPLRDADGSVRDDADLSSRLKGKVLEKNGETCRVFFRRDRTGALARGGMPQGATISVILQYRL